MIDDLNSMTYSHEDQLADLLAMALDDADEIRLRMFTRWLLRQDLDAASDLNRLRQTGTIPTVTRL